MLRAGQALATWQSPAWEMPPAHPRQPTCPWRLTATRGLRVRRRIIEKTRPHEKTVALFGLPFRLFQILGKFVESHSEYFKHTYNVI